MSLEIFQDSQSRILTDNISRTLSFRRRNDIGRNTNMKFIMAGVAAVDMFDGDKLFGTATTLTDSSLTIGLSTEDIRGGEGAGLLGRYFHTSTFELTLTDALFNMDYIAASVGADIKGGANVIFNEQRDGVNVAAGQITLSHAGVPLTGCTSDDVIGWYRLAGEDEWNQATITGTTMSDSGIEAGNTYCVKYFYNEDAADRIRIEANYVPKTLHLVLKENLYAASETNNAETKVGYVVIDIPRFQLDGNQDLSMSMTGASTTSLKGSALISGGCNAGCEGGYYAEMSQVIKDAKWYDGIDSIAADGGSVVTGETMSLYAIFDNKTPRKITPTMLTGLTLKAGATTISDLTAPAAGSYALTLTDGDGNLIASGSLTVVSGT